MTNNFQALMLQVLVLLVPELLALPSMSTTSHLPLSDSTRVVLQAHPSTTLAHTSATVTSSLVRFDTFYITFLH